MNGAWYVFVIFVFFDCMQIVVNGALSALNLTKQVKFTTMISYWVFGLPLSYVLLNHAKMGIEGLWYGPTLAVAINFFVYEIKITKADW